MHHSENLLWQQVSATGQGANQVLLPANPRRKAVIISAPPATFSMVVRFGTAAQNSSDGFPILAGSSPLYLTGEHIGSAIKEEIDVWASPGINIGAIEVFG